MAIFDSQEVTSDTELLAVADILLSMRSQPATQQTPLTQPLLPLLHHRQGAAYRKERLVIFKDYRVGGRARVDEEWSFVTKLNRNQVVDISY